MNVPLSPETQTRVRAEAAKKGCTPEQLLADIVHDLFAPDNPEFEAAVKVGMEQARRGQLIDDEEVWRRMEAKHPELKGR